MCSSCAGAQLKRLYTNAHSRGKKSRGNQHFQLSLRALIPQALEMGGMACAAGALRGTAAGCSRARQGRRGGGVALCIRKGRVSLGKSQGKGLWGRYCGWSMLQSSQPGRGSRENYLQAAVSVMIASACSQGRLNFPGVCWKQHCRAAAEWETCNVWGKLPAPGWGSRPGRSPHQAETCSNLCQLSQLQFCFLTTSLWGRPFYHTQQID